MNLKIDRDYILRTLTDLVKINSVNPSLSPDGKGETEIGAYYGMRGSAVSQSSRRFKGRVREDDKLRRMVAEIVRQLGVVES